MFWCLELVIFKEREGIEIISTFVQNIYKKYHYKHGLGLVDSRAGREKPDSGRREVLA